MPSFDGNSAIFGIHSEFTTRPHAPRVQHVQFNGVNGRFAQHLGHNGGQTFVEVLIYAADLPTLYTIETAIEAYAIAGASIVANLVDNTGRVWTNVHMAQAQPAQNIQAINNGYGRRWQYIFEHLA